MKSLSCSGRKSCKMPSKEQLAKKAILQRKVERGMHIIGMAIIVLVVIAGFVLSFLPRVFGLQTSNPAIGFALAILAGIRLWALRVELRKESQANI